MPDAAGAKQERQKEGFPRIASVRLEDIGVFSLKAGPQLHGSRSSSRAQALGLTESGAASAEDRRAAMGSQPPFGTRVEEHNGVAIMALSGELDMATAPILMEDLTHVEDGGAKTIMLDLSEVTFIDSPGLLAFLTARSRAMSNGHRLLISGPSPAARRLLELTATQFLLGEQGSGGTERSSGSQARRTG